MPTPIEIELSKAQMMVVEQEAQARHDAVKARGGISLGPSTNPLGQDMIGVMGELAFATWSGLPWTASRGATYSNKVGDVGNLEIRTRRRHTDQDLFVKNKKFQQQPPSTFYVLTIADEDNPTVLLIGWTTLGTIAEYGYTRQYDSTGFRQTDLLDLKELFRGREPQHR